MKNKIVKILKIKNKNIFLNKEIALPSSKSYLNRVLILSALQKKRTIIYNINDICTDVNDMISALIKLGIRIDIKRNGKKTNIIVYGNGGKFTKPHDGKINCGLGGTTARFLLALSALFDFSIEITAKGRMCERPINEMFKFLKTTGKRITFIKKTDCLPIKVDGKIRSIKKISVNGNKSSQFLSAILMVADQVGIEEIFVKNLVSKSYVKMTLGLLKKYNIYFTQLSSQEGDFCYKRKKTCKTYASTNHIVRIKAEEDWSSASYFLALQFLFNIRQNFLNLSNRSLQGDAKFIKILEKIKRNNKTEKLLTLSMNDMPDVSMTAMIICCLQDFNTKITGLETLKNKECNRLLAMKNEFKKLGIRTEITNSYDAITIYGNNKLKLENQVVINSYNDHRIAMCFAILGCKVGNIAISNSDVVSKSFPNFWYELDKFHCVQFDKSIL